MKKPKIKEWIEAGRHSEFTICSHLTKPEEAELLLSLNTINRKLHPPYVAALAQSMKKEWLNNYSPIVVSRTPSLLDGQHRLTACANARIPFVCDIRFGAEDPHFTNIDTNKVRGVADFTSILGVAKGHECVFAAAIHLMWRYDNGSIGHVSGKIPRSTFERLAIDNVRMNDSAPFAYKCYKNCGVSKGAVLFLHYRFSQINKEQADEFFERLASGVASTANDPILILIRLFNNNRAARRRMPTSHHVPLMIKAWNDYRKGRGRTSLSFKDGEALPAIQ